jgi:hypothetical protein
LQLGLVFALRSELAFGFLFALDFRMPMTSDLDFGQQSESWFGSQSELSFRFGLRTDIYLRLEIQRGFDLQIKFGLAFQPLFDFGLPSGRASQSAICIADATSAGQS